ncbi:hypothetical protein ACJIZ3_004465 [Penstemon smallii]|uniref:Uncharacterized protein n=1 Tax=Penstemon smallii TaxID=265156 RepID=A0ABD3S2B3_9LAMI
MIVDYYLVCFYPFYIFCLGPIMRDYQNYLSRYRSKVMGEGQLCPSHHCLLIRRF